MIGLLLGAGFSKWAADLPLAAELFDFDIAAHNQRDARKLQRIATRKREWDGRNPGGLSEHFVSEMIRSSIRDKKLVTWYVTRRLSDPFVGRMLGGTQALMIDDKRKFQSNGVRVAHEVLSGFPQERLSGVVTTNYDLLVEYAIGTAAFNYGRPGEALVGRGKNPWFPWQGIPVELTGSLRLAKIHGSVSWDDKHHYTDGRCGVNGTALIVPPSPDKQMPSLLRSTWALAEDIIRDTNELWVFGFAFNQYDVAVLSLLESAGRRLKSVLLIDPQPKEQLARQVWPAASLQVCEPPTRDDSTLKKWLRSLLTE